MERGYKLSDRIGRKGIEAAFESELRGKWGGEMLEIDSIGTVQRSLGLKLPKAGKDIQLTLDLDPDNEFIWNEESLKKVNHKFTELVEERAGKSLDDYELRKIGSEIEGLIKYLLQNGLLSYNPECRVMNYSMGLPKTKEVL